MARDELGEFKISEPSTNPLDSSTVPFSFMEMTEREGSPDSLTQALMYEKPKKDQVRET